MVAGEAELGRTWCEQVFSGECVNKSMVLDSLEKAYLVSAWGGCEGQVVRTYMRNNQVQGGGRSKHLVYFCWFKQAERGWPQYLAGLPCKSVRAMMKQLARFRLSAHKLQVEVGRHQGVLWENRLCTRCEASGHGQWVDDEQHMIFECHAFEDLRTSMEGARFLIDRSSGCVQRFMRGEMEVVRGFVSACMDRLE